MRIVIAAVVVCVMVVVGVQSETKHVIYDIIAGMRDKLPVMSNYTSAVVDAATENWAYPLDMCVATGAYGTGQRDAIFTCIGDGQILAAFYKQGHDCDDNKMKEMFVWNYTGIEEGHRGYAVCDGENNWGRFQYALGEECETPDFTYYLTAATGVCVFSENADDYGEQVYTYTECDQEAITVTVYNGSSCAEWDQLVDVEVTYPVCEEIQDDLTMELFDGLVSLTIPAYVRMDVCVQDDIFSYSTDLPEGDEDISIDTPNLPSVDTPSLDSDDLPDSDDIPGHDDNDGTTESFSRHIIENYGIGPAPGAVMLFAYPLETCTSRGTMISGKGDAIFSCSESGNKITRSNFKSTDGSCTDPLGEEEDKVYVKDESLLPGQRGYFKCDGLINEMRVRYRYDSNCGSDDYYDQTMATYVCLQPHSMVEMFTFTSCVAAAGIKQTQMFMYTNSECDGEPWQTLNTDSECKEYAEQTIDGTTYIVTAEVKNCKYGEESNVKTTTAKPQEEDDTTTTKASESETTTTTADSGSGDSGSTQVIDSGGDDDDDDDGSTSGASRVEVYLAVLIGGILSAAVFTF